MYETRDYDHLEFLPARQKEKAMVAQNNVINPLDKMVVLLTS